MFDVHVIKPTLSLFITYIYSLVRKVRGEQIRYDGDRSDRHMKRLESEQSCRMLQSYQ